MTTSQNHPSDDVLIRFALGGLSDRESTRAKRHLDQCHRCCQFLAKLKTDSAIQWPINQVVEDAEDETASCSRAPVSVILTVVKGPHVGRKFTFNDHDTFLVGRGPQAHFRLPKKDEFFSRLHFMVEVNPPLCRLMDLKSRNGTWVNGKEVTTAYLKDGDQIRGGKTVLIVRIAKGEPGTSQADNDIETRDAKMQQRFPLLRAASTDYENGPRPQHCRGCGRDLALHGSKLLLCKACDEKAERLDQPVTGYRLIEELGRGGMGVVYRAIRKSDGLGVALKTIIPENAGSKRAVRKFLREASIVGEMEHPNIVRYVEMGDCAGKVFFFVMELVEGTDANKLLRQKGPLPIKSVLGIVDQLLKALHYAHVKGFVHRDVKPANLLLAKRRSRSKVLLADFGLARAYHASSMSGMTMVGDVGGTLPFMAPEQITNFRESKPAVDQYSAAATAYNLLTKRYVFDFPSDPQERFLMVLQEKPVPLRRRRADIPQKLEKVIHKALRSNPEDRFKSVESFRKQLRECC